MSPFFSAFFSAFLLLLLPYNLQANDDVSSSLPGQQQQQQQQQHRSLQTTSTTTRLVLPFGIQWILTVSEQAAAQIGFDARAPTPEEYDEIRQATEDWFTAEIPLIYANNDDFTYDGIACNIFDTTYNATSNPWYHSILMNCQVTFAASSQDVLPTNTQFLLDMNADFMLDQFREQHLLAITNGFFQWSSQVGYVTTNTGDYYVRPAADNVEVLISEDIGTVPTTETPVNKNFTMTTNTTNTITVVATNATAAP